MQAVVLGDGVEGWENLEPGLGSSLSASLLAPGSLTPSSSSSSSSPSQDTAETPCPLTVSLLQDTALLGVPGGCLYQTFLSISVYQAPCHMRGTQIWAQTVSVNLMPAILVFPFCRGSHIHSRVFIEHLQ